jgi:hypothetical protein
VDRLGTWPARGTWLLLPLLIGTVLGDALAGASPPVQWVAAIGLWGGWAAVLVATLVPRSISLTALRIAVLAAAGASLVAVVVGHSPTGWRVAALSWAIVCVAVAFFPATGEAFVDGESYGDEHRYPLRVPGPLLAGPLALAWAAVVAGVAAGPLLLACRLWVVGLVALAVGLPVAWRAARALHVLSTRFVVLVPAGFVLHDPLALTDPVLFRRASVRALGPASAGTDALDLTCGALGLALEAQLVEETDLPTVAPRRGAPSATVETQAVLFTPTRPGALLTATRARHIG